MTFSADFMMQALGIAAGAIILHFALAAINRMGVETHHGVRVAFLLIATGAAGMILDPLLSRPAGSAADLMLSGGLALLLLFDRRCVSCPISTIKGERRRGKDRNVSADAA